MASQRLFGGQQVVQFREQSDRRTFLRMAGLVGVGASLAGAGLLASPGLAAAAGSPQNDIDILNYALVFEYLEADFYATALKLKLLAGRQLQLVTAITDHETTHIGALRGAVTGLGGKPMAKPSFAYPSMTWSNAGSILSNASTLEEIGVSSYQGQISLLSDPDIVATAASIAGVESRHAASIASLAGGNPFPYAIEAHRTKDQVLKIIQPLVTMS